MFNGEDYNGFDYLRVFGEVGIATQGQKIRSKLDNRGEACLYLGHAGDHGSDVHRLMKISTKRVIRSRDVKWLNQRFDEFMRDEERLKMIMRIYPALVRTNQMMKKLLMMMPKQI